jgi:predicted outer membrane repeat protein
MKRLLKILAALLVIGVLGSCNLVVGPNEPAGNSLGGGDSGGTLTISFGEEGAANSRAITSGADLPGDVLAGMRYDLFLTGPNNETIERTVSGGETLSLTVTPGQWRIDSQGYYLDVLAGTGSVTISVLAGENPVRIPMMMSGPCYEVTVDPGIAHGAVQPNFALAFEGTPITLTVTPDSDSVLKAGAVTYNDGTIDHVVAGPSYAFTMPASDVTVSAEFDLLYRVIIAPLTGGTVAADFSSTVEGTPITLTVTPDLGYALKTGTLKYNDGSDHVIAGPAYTFILPNSDVTVNAEFIQFVRYVRMGGAGDGTSWDNASNDIQVMMDALAAIPSSDYTGPRIVKAAAGTYKPQYVPTNGVSANGTPDRTTTASTTNRDSAFILRKGVQVWGGYPASGGDVASRNIAANETILSGDIDNNNTLDAGNAYHVVLAMGVDRTTVLNGLTITGGNAGDDGTSLGTRTITVYGGKSVYCNNGGGIYSGTVDTSRSYSPVLVNVKISGNKSFGDSGGMYNYGDKPVLINVLISGNTSGDQGGGIFNTNGSSLFLTNVTVSGNSATSGGGAVYNKISSMTIWNSVIWGNTSGIDGSATISNSIVQGGWGGSGNQNVDPLFVGAIAPSAAPVSGGNYRLNGSSPAIHAGNSDSYPDTWTKWQTLIGAGEGIADEDDYNMYIAPHLGKDLAGNTRKNGSIDMGAYEKN